MHYKTTIHSPDVLCSTPGAPTRPPTRHARQRPAVLQMQPHDSSGAPAAPAAGSNDDGAAPAAGVADHNMTASPSPPAAAAAEEPVSLPLLAEGGSAAAAEPDSADTVPPAVDVLEASAAASAQPDAEQPPSDELPYASAATADTLPAAADKSVMGAAGQNSMQSTIAAVDCDAAAYLATEPTPGGTTTDKSNDASPAGEDAAALTPTYQTIEQQAPAGDSGGDSSDVKVPPAAAAAEITSMSLLPEAAEPMPVWTTAAVRLSK